MAVKGEGGGRRGSEEGGKRWEMGGEEKWEMGEERGGRWEERRNGRWGREEGGGVKGEGGSQKVSNLLYFLALLVANCPLNTPGNHESTSFHSPQSDSIVNRR